MKEQRLQSVRMRLEETYLELDLLAVQCHNRRMVALLSAPKKQKLLLEQPLDSLKLIRKIQMKTKTTKCAKPELWKYYQILRHYQP